MSTEPPVEPAELVVVLVDDDELDRMTARRALADVPLSLTIEEFASGHQAAERLTGEPAPDIVLLDYSMPGFDGFEVLAHLEEAGVQLPVIMMTGLDGDEEHVVEAIRRGAYDYISKSRLEPSTLLAKIRAARRLHRARQAARQAQLDLEQAVADLQQAVNARDSVLAVVSHDLRGPLNNIQLSASLLESDDPSHWVVAVGSIRRAVVRAERLITDLMDISRLERGRLELHPEPVSVRSLLDMAVGDVRMQADKVGTTIEIALDDDVRLVCDRPRIVQVIDNLLRNALRYGPDGGHVRASARALDDGVELCVEDEGPGVDEAEAVQVFERFWQSQTRPVAVGSGLGLAIAKGIVEQHGGVIGVERSSLGGARFYFVLPATPGDRETEPSRPASGEHSRSA